jgi:FeoB-associated Cys-rich membrane protein
MIQQIIIIGLFVVAAAYLGRLLYRSFQSKNVCESGCGKCGAVDFEKIEKQLQKRT